ncbi:hypothetical protein [Streptomyces sp. NPDC051577]|uniref:hypothetical protein n=1 Tax=Streptomyces sp. NPDC051577 TaxID=3155166 RepID=UPI00341A16B0
MAPAPASKARPARTEAPPTIVGVIVIDAGEGRELKEQGPGQFRWGRHPSARYECRICRTSTDTVTGSLAVRRFLDHIRSTHQATCTGATIEGAHAA